MSPAKKKTTKKKTAAKKKAPAKKKAAAKKKAPAKKKAVAKKKAPAKKKAAPEKSDAVAETEKAEVAAPPEPPKKEHPPLSKRIRKPDLRIIRTKLLQRRDELAGTIDSIESAHLGTHENRTTTGGDEADQATNAQNADISLRLAESGSRELKEIDAAIAKINDGTYGICEATGELIGLPRLKYLPWIRLSVDAQEKVERDQLRYDESEGWIVP